MQTYYFFPSLSLSLYSMHITHTYTYIYIYIFANEYKIEKKWHHPVVSVSLQAHGLYPDRLLCPWDSPGKNIGMCCHFLLQGIFPTQWSTLGLLLCRQTLYQLRNQGIQKYILYMLVIIITINTGVFLAYISILEQCVIESCRIEKWDKIPALLVLYPLIIVLVYHVFPD